MIFQQLSMRTNLIMCSFALAAFALIAITIINFQSVREQLHMATVNRLIATREEKKTEIEQAFRDLAYQCLTISESTMSFDSMRLLKQAFYALDINDNELESYKKELIDFYEKEFLPKINVTSTIKKTVNDFFPQDKKTILFQTLYIARNPNSLGNKKDYSKASNGSLYDEVHAKYHSIYSKYLTRFGFSDMYFIDMDTGYVIFNLSKEIDFAANLLTGPLKDTGLAKVFRECQKTSDENFVLLTDFSFYDPSYGLPVSFIGTPIFENGKKIGVLVFNFPINKINSIMTYDKRWQDVGFGATGETYLVGDDKLMRSLSRSFIEDREFYFHQLQQLSASPEVIDKMKIYNTTILLQLASSMTTQDIAQKKNNTFIGADYLGNQAIISHAPLSIKNLNWHIIAKIDIAEAFSPIRTIAWHTLLWSIGILIFVLFFSFYCIRKATRPLTQLLALFADRKSSGSINLIDLPVGSGPGIGIIVHSYNQAIQIIKHIVGNVEVVAIHIQQTIDTLNSYTISHKQVLASLNIALQSLSGSIKSFKEHFDAIDSLTDGQAQSSAQHSLTIHTQYRELKQELMIMRTTLTTLLEKTKEASNHIEETHAILSTASTLKQKLTEIVDQITSQMNG